MPRSIQLVISNLIFWIYEEVGGQHHEKHVEVTYKRERKAVFDLETGKMLSPLKERNFGLPEQRRLPKDCLNSDEIKLAKKLSKNTKLNC